MIEPQLGVVFPNKDIGASPSDLNDFAPLAEAACLDFIVAYDHIVGVHPDFLDDSQSECRFDADTNIHEVIVVLSAMAARTQNIRLVSGCLITPQRNTLLVAKQAAELDIISNGRLDLGVSIGWNEAEFLALGADYSTRARRLGGQINLMRRLWTESDVVDEEAGLQHISIKPKPVQQPIPVWVGGLAQQAIERAIIFGDGWLPLGKYDDAMHQKIKYYFEYEPDEPTGRSKQVMGRVNPWNTSHESAMDEMRDWSEAGASHIAIGSSENVFDNKRQYFSELREFLNYVRKNRVHGWN